MNLNCNREAMSTADPAEVKKVGKNLGYGTISFESAEAAKDFSERETIEKPANACVLV